MNHYARWCVRGMAITECSVDGHSALMLAARITFAHFSLSSTTSFPKSAGEPGTTVPPRSASRAFTLGSASAALISLLSLSTISTLPLPSHPVGLLRARRQRPSRRAAEQRDELALVHSITSSARASSVGGISTSPRPAPEGLG